MTKKRNRRRHKIALIVALAMLFQITSPLVQHAHAAIVGDDFKVVSEEIHEGTAFLDWEWTPNLENNDTNFTYQGNFTLGGSDPPLVEESLVTDDGREIGVYTVSPEGKIRVAIDYVPEEEELSDPEVIEEETDIAEEDADLVEDPVDEEDTDATDEDVDLEEEAVDEEDIDLGEDIDLDVEEDVTDEEETDATEEDADLEEEAVDEDTDTDVDEDTDVDLLSKLKGDAVALASTAKVAIQPVAKVEPVTYRGTIVVPGVVAKEPFPQKMMNMMMGIMSGTPTELGPEFDFKVVEAKVKLNDTVLELNIDDDIKVKNNDKIEIEYHWTIEDGGLTPGDWAIIKIPSAFKPESEMKGSIKCEGVEFGSYLLPKDSNELIITFGKTTDGKDVADFDDFNTRTDRGGEVEAKLTFDVSYFEKNVVQEISFYEDTDKTYTIVMKPKDGAGAEITKGGEADKTKNATKIDWTIDVNTNLKEINNAEITDTLPSAVGIVEDLKVYHLIVGYNGGLTLGDPVEKGVDHEEFSGFPVRLGNIDSAYRITYTTQITDFNATEFENSAKINDGTSVEKKVSTEVGKLIENKAGEANKSAKNSTVIDWSFDLNTREANFGEAVVMDVLADGLTLVGDSVEIYKLNVQTSETTGSAVVLSDLDFEVEYLDDNKKLQITLKNVEGTAYRVIYKTAIDYTLVNSSDTHPFGKEYTFKNKASITVDSGSQVDSNEAEVKVTRATLVEKKGEKTTAPEKKEIKWTIEVNKANATLKDVKITDTLTNHTGLDLNNVEFTIKNMNKNTIKMETLTASGGVFTINLMEILDVTEITDYYTITYTTLITNLDQDKFYNSAKVEAKENGHSVEGVIGSGDVEPGIPSKPTIAKSSTGIDYKDKTMSWRTDIMVYKGQVTVLSVYDEFPYKDMIFIEDSLDVWHYEDSSPKSGDLLTKDTHYTVAKKDDKGQEGFVIEFIFDSDKLNDKALQDSRIRIEYDTTFDPNETGKKGGPESADETPQTYVNKIKYDGKLDYSGDKDITGEDTAERKIADIPYKNGTKTGMLDEKDRQIDWKLYLNYLGKELDEYVVTDTLSTGQVIEDLDEITIKPYTLSDDGAVKSKLVCKFLGVNSSVVFI